MRARRKLGPSEDQIQAAIIEWANLITHKGRPLSDYLHHSPNGGYRNGREGAKFKRMGVKAGYPDLILDIAKGGYHGLRIELKTDKGRVSKLQHERLQMLSDEGYYAVVCHGLDEAVGVIKEYISLEKLRFAHD